MTDPTPETLPAPPAEALAETPAAPVPAALAPEAPVETEAPPVCASCGTARVGPFCHACGEKKLDRHDYAFLHVAEHAVDTFTHLDVKVVKSIWSLLARPGVMAADVLAGRRVAWAKPFQTFLIANLLFYLFSTWAGVSFFDAPLEMQLGTFAHSLKQPLAEAKAAALGLTLEAYAEPYNHLSHTLSKTLNVLLVPIIAGILALLFWKQKRYILEHVTVAALLMSQFMLVSILAILIPALFGAQNDFVFIPSVLGANSLLFYFTFRRVYPDPVARKAVMAVRAGAFTFLMMSSIIYIFRPLLFLITNAFT